MVIDKIDTRKLEQEISDLEERAKYLYHAYEENGLPSDYDDVVREGVKKNDLLKALKQMQKEG